MKLKYNTILIIALIDTLYGSLSWNFWVQRFGKYVWNLSFSRIGSQSSGSSRKCPDFNAIHFARELSFRRIEGRFVIGWQCVCGDIDLTVHFGLNWLLMAFMLLNDICVNLHIGHCKGWNESKSSQSYHIRPDVLRLTIESKAESPLIDGLNMPVVELVDVRAADPSSEESIALRKRAKSLATCQQPAVRAASSRRVAYLRETEDFSKFCNTIIYEAAVSNCPSERHF